MDLQRSKKLNFYFRFENGIESVKSTRRIVLYGFKGIKDKNPNGMYFGCILQDKRGRNAKPPKFSK